MIRPLRAPQSEMPELNTWVLSESYFFSSVHSHASGASKTHGQVWYDDAHSVWRRLPFTSVLVANWLQGRDCPTAPSDSAEPSLQRRTNAAGFALSDDPRPGTH